MNILSNKDRIVKGKNRQGIYKKYHIDPHNYFCEKLAILGIKLLEVLAYQICRPSFTCMFLKWGYVNKIYYSRLEGPFRTGIFFSFEKKAYYYLVYHLSLYMLVKKKSRSAILTS